MLPKLGRGIPFWSSSPVRNRLPPDSYFDENIYHDTFIAPPSLIDFEQKIGLSSRDHSVPESRTNDYEERAIESHFVSWKLAKMGHFASPPFIANPGFLVLYFVTH